MIIPWNFTRRYNLEEWEKIIEDWEKSGLTKHDYCKKQKLVYQTFCNWERKISPSTPLSYQNLKERWEKIIKNWEKSGLNQHAYCSAKGLNYPVFMHWEKKLNPHIFRKTKDIKAVERWTPLVADWEKSGLTKGAYCKKHRLAQSDLCRWVKLLDSPKALEMSTDVIEKPKSEDLQEPMAFSFFKKDNSIDSSTLVQRMDVRLSQGEHFCLEGPFDWPKLMTWLTPLLTR